MNKTQFEVAQDNKTTISNALIARGVDVHAIDVNENTALILGAFRRHTEMVEALIARSANPNEACSPAYYATLSLSSSSNITRTTSTVTIVETPEERRRKTDAGL
jgi:ankyrin repeat protein